jgi:hypothetical protein
LRWIYLSMQPPCHLAEQLYLLARNALNLGCAGLAT